MASVAGAVLRANGLPSRRNASKLASYLYEESNRVRPSTLNSRLDALTALGRHLDKRDWKRATRNDVIRVIAEHRSLQGAHLRTGGAAGKPLAASTRYQWSVHMCQFYKWLLHSDDRPPQFRRLPFRKIDAMAARIKELALSPAEVRQLLSGATNARDKCIIGVAIEAGFRASESAALRLDYMEARNHGWWLELPPDEPALKTGVREAAVPVIAVKKLVDDWLAEHPRINDPKAPLYVTLSNRSYGKRMSGPSVAAVIARCARRAGMRKVHSHMTRHSSVTLKIAKQMSPEAVRIIHGWSRRSTMLGYYTGSLPNFESIVLSVHGLRSDEPELLDIMGSQPCLLCGTALHAADATCKGCGISGNFDAAQAQARRQQDAAVSFVALELAASMGWGPTERHLEDALGFLRGEHANAGAPENFAPWCLKQWARRCVKG